MIRAGDEDYGYDEGIPLISGGISGMGLPFDLSDDDAELCEREKRRKPVGFAPWPADDEQPSASHLRIA